MTFMLNVLIDILGQICQVIFEGINDKCGGHLQYFFKHLAYDTWEAENVGGIFRRSFPNPYVKHATPFDDRQFGRASYKNLHAPCAPISCKYCYSFDHDSLLNRL